MDKKSKLISLTSFIIFVIIMILVIFKLTKPFDDYIYNILKSIQSKNVDSFFKIVTRLGNPGTIIVIIIFSLILLKKSEKHFLLINSLNCLLTEMIIKIIIRRKRPSVIHLIKQKGYSFPSGHAMISISVYGFFIILVANKIKNKYLKYMLIIFLSLIIILIGLSRIYVGVHFASDIIAGYMLSLSELIFMNNLLKKQIGGKNV